MINGRLIDLTRGGVRLPPLLVVDSSVMFEAVIANHPRATASSAARAAGFLRSMQTSGTTGVITPTVAKEVFHLLLRARLIEAVPAYRSDLIQQHPRRRPGTFTWRDVYKLDSSLVGHLPRG